MAIVMTTKVPFGADVYDRVNEQMNTESNLPDGLISHYAAKDGDQMLICDLWESKEDCERFTNERLMPALEKVLGGPPPEGGPQPTMAELHNEFHR